MRIALYVRFYAYVLKHDSNLRCNNILKNNIKYKNLKYKRNFINLGQNKYLIN